MDQLAKRLLLAALRQLLKVVDQQNVPRLRQRVKREVRRSTLRPSSSASASVLFPKPQGALTKSTLPRWMKLSNRCWTAGFMIMLPAIVVPPSFETALSRRLIPVY
jgi:hypothetical protein